MKNLQLSEHFTLSEFPRSATAERLHIDNTPSEEDIQNLKTLCTEVLEPLRCHVCQPIIISSGYRCPKLNKAVGGVYNSQHTNGQAADIAAPTVDSKGKRLSPALSLSLLREWMRWAIDNLSFDQCIMEHSKQKNGTVTHWMHISFSKGQNRQCVISNLWK